MFLYIDFNKKDPDYIAITPNNQGLLFLNITLNTQLIQQHYYKEDSTY